MTPIALFLAAVGMDCAPVPPAAEKPVGNMAAIEKQFHGTWAGQGPCVGDLAIAADRTYQRIHHGPGGTNSAGTWAVRWEAHRPTLILTCKTSDDPADVGKIELKLIRLDDDHLALTYPKSPKPGKVTTYSRVKK